MAFLLAINGANSGNRFVLDGERSVLGRHPGCDVVLDVGAVSRQHAQITRAGGDFYLEDLASRNGTFLNDLRLEERTRLHDGDTLRICELAFTFFDEPEDAGFVPPDVEETGQTLESSGFAAVMVDDTRSSEGSTIMSKVDMTGSRTGATLSASPEAKLNALISINQSLGKALALDDVLPQVLNGLFKIFLQADRGFIVLREDDGRLAPRWTKVRREDPAHDTIRISRTIINQVMETREAVLSADAASDERFDMSQSIADFRIRSMMCAPLIDLDGKSFGALQIDTLDQRNRFEQEELEVLSSVASQAAIAINNAQLHERSLRQRELERDLKLAHQVQKGFLPEHPPELSGYAFFDFYQPANHVGGDYFDYVPLPDGRLAVLMADVVGHGVAAALLMAKLSAESRYNLAAEPHPARSLSLLNNAIARLPFEDRFITMVMMVLDPASGSIELANAGHMSPIIRQSDGSLREPGHAEAGIPLGILDDMEYEQVVFQLEPGDTLLLYTDGVNEAMNHANELYGIERIRQQLGAAACSDSGELGKSLIDDVRRFLAGSAQDDDMCFVLLGRTA